MVKMINKTINVKYFDGDASKPLENFVIEGSLRYAGYSTRTAADITSIVFNNIRKKFDTISFLDLVQYTAEEVKHIRIKKNYLAMNQFLMATYERKVTTPFYFLIGGASHTGKDNLANDLSHFLGTETPISTDHFRNQTREEILQQYDNKEENIPDDLKLIFGASYKVGIEGFLLQVKYVGKKITEEIGQTTRQGQDINRPLYIMQGIHIVPGTEENIDGDNKHIVILNPSYETLKSKNMVRFEQERGGPAKTQGEQDIRDEDFERLYSIQEFILQRAREKEISIIYADDREDILHEFANSLTPRLEEILQKAGIDLIES